MAHTLGDNCNDSIDSLSSAYFLQYIASCIEADNLLGVEVVAMEKLHAACAVQGYLGIWCDLKSH